MANSYFRFKQFTIHQDRCAMKVTTDGCLFGAWVAEQIKSKNLKEGICLDIGAGTGLLSIMLAQKNPSLRINAVEIDEQAARQAQDNADTSPWKKNITVLPGDVKDMAHTFRREYDLIISNPPFYENELNSPQQQKNTAHHDSGLVLNELTTIISNTLAPAGYFYLLLPYKRFTDIKEQLSLHQLRVTQILFVRHSASHPFSRLFIEGQLGIPGNDVWSSSEIAIKEEAEKYSSEFTALLKDYYLNF